MRAILREIQIPQKSEMLLGCDFILEPLNIVFDCKKVALENEIWIKKERIQNIFVKAISFVYCCFFSPVVLTAIVLKSSSEEHKWASQAYSLWKKKMFFRKKGYKIDHTEYLSSNRFSLTLSKRVNNFPKEKPNDRPVVVTFDSYGKFRYKEFFQTQTH